MATIKNVFLFVFLSIFATGCNQGLKKEVDQLNQDKQQMQATINEQNRNIATIKNILNEIDQKLKSSITDEEILQKINSEGDLNQRVNVVVAEIKKLLQQNQKELESLNKDLNNSDYKVRLLRKEVSKMQKSIDSKIDSIMLFQDRVVMLNDRISVLDEQVNALLQKNRHQEEDIDEMTEKLNTVAYTIGTSGELMEKGITEKVGGFLGLFGRTEQLKPDFSISSFTIVNKMETKTIELNTKKAELVTTHPAGSYKLQEENNKITKLIITNPEEFWKASKFLVIQVR